MAFCIKCGTELSDGANFCPKCGASVGSIEKTVNVQADLPVNNPINVPQKTGKSKGNKKLLIFGIVAGVLLLAIFIAVLCLAVLGMGQSEKTLESLLGEKKIAELREEFYERNRDSGYFSSDLSIVDNNIIETFVVEKTFHSISNSDYYDDPEMAAIYEDFCKDMEKESYKEYASRLQEEYDSYTDEQWRNTLKSLVGDIKFKDDITFLLVFYDGDGCYVISYKKVVNGTSFGKNEKASTSLMTSESYLGEAGLASLQRDCLNSASNNPEIWDSSVYVTGNTMVMTMVMSDAYERSQIAGWGEAMRKQYDSYDDSYWTEVRNQLGGSSLVEDDITVIYIVFDIDLNVLSAYAKII